MMHVQQICEFLQQQHWAYQSNPQEQQVQLQREGLTVLISLEEDGKFVKIVLPQVLTLNPDQPHYELGLQCLLHLGWQQDKLVRWQRDPRDGEVRLQADLPLEDGELSSRQFWRTLQGCLQIAQQGRKQVQQVLQTGAESGRTTRTTGMNSGVNAQAGEQMAFLSILFKKILECNGAAEQIYPLLREHLSLLNADLIPALQQSWQSLQRQNPEQSQELVPALFVTFGNLIQQFPLGNRPLNLEIAIACYHAALTVWTRETAPLDWAGTQHNLGTAYWQLPTGDRARNLQQAIACYNAALTVRTRETAPLDWAMTQTNLGTAYSDLPTGDRAGNLEQAISCYNAALTVRTRERAPLQWAGTQNNLGNAYSDLPTGDRAENLQQAIGCYHAALTVWTRETAPLDWATTQNNLGLAYWQMPTGDHAGNLQQAINCYNAALTVWTRETAPLDWAMTQTNLGTAYSDLPTGDRAGNLQQAIRCYNAALTVWTRETAPLQWATTQNNLGTAYQKLPKGDRASNLQQAIACYNKALSVRTRERAPLQWAGTQNNLGNAYWQLPTGDRAGNLQQAIACYNKALSVRTRETAPLDWATTQNNLGNAYWQLPTGDRAGNLQQAIGCYHAALTVWTRETAPLDWAMTQNNLGNAYLQLPTGDRAGNLQQAIACYNAALTVWTPQLFPLECLKTARNWGNLEFREGQWHNALTQYQTAIEAIEQSRRFALSEERRQQIVQESIYVYENAIQAAINLKDIASALEIVERVRAKRLVDLMATADLYQDGAIPAAVQDWLHRLDQLDQKIAQRRQNVASTSTETPEAPTSPEDSPNTPPETPEDDAAPGDSPKLRHGVSRQLRAAMTATQEIQELEQEKQAILDQLSNRDDVVAKLREVQPPKLQDFQPLLSENTALVSFYTTRTDTHLLILRSGESQPVCFTCPGQGLETLQLWLRQTWAMLYLQDGRQKPRWIAQMPATLQELAQRLHLNEVIEQHLQGIEELVLVPHLFLHQIPFAALPIQDSGQRTYLGDRFRLRYAPSLQVLGFCQGRQAVETREYGTVENATDDLPFSSFEGMTVAHLFEIESQRRLIGAQAKTTAYRGLLEASNYLVSSHHAQSRWDNPLESGLKLSDGTITVSQLFSPAWRFPQLEEVYLSCCETGLFLPDSALDEPVAVSTGFLCAGARGVIASQWSIYDLSAALVSGLYHQQRHRGLSRVAALQRAQQEMRQMTGEEFQQAYAKPLKTYLKSEQRRLQQDVEAVHRLQNGERLIKRYCHEAHPFEHPVHWAGLGCYGLG
ncbi:MAG: hypothetical protein HLUCCO16_06345 [Phormidium sp. OSCR]|nr:MAG: hypothetical protein HLUCCO16_06345 [Phormidium sp. OSCR]